MGKMFCGCEIYPGQPVTPETVKAHKEHTLTTMFFWDIIVRHSATPEQQEARDKLMEARIAYQEALDKAYPG
jgi:hypothetical protein